MPWVPGAYFEADFSIDKFAMWTKPKAEITQTFFLSVYVAGFNASLEPNTGVHPKKDEDLIKEGQILLRSFESIPKFGSKNWI